MRSAIFSTVALGVMVAGAAMTATPAMADVKAGVDAWSKGDFRKAIDEWRPLAVKGDADAQFNLAQAYKLGRGVPLDPVLAQSWFYKAALQGHLQAQDNYGLALFQADRKADAVPWLEKSVARGEPRAQLVLGTMLFNGDGVPRDYPRAYALMTRASSSGLQSASQTLSQMDQYISPADRERGTALAQQYAAQEKVEQVRQNSVAPAATAPIRIADAGPPQRLPAAKGPERVAPPAPASTPAPTPAKQPVVASKPAPKPVATPKPAGNWRIQLGAFRDQGNAESLWSRVHGKLAGVQPSYVKGGGVTRLQAGGYASRAEATRACTRAGSPCVVVAP